MSNLGILVEGVYSPGQGCVLTYINNKILAANLVYSMCIDFIVLALTGWKLLRLRSNQRKGLVGLLFQDGLIYFASSYVHHFTNLGVSMFKSI